LTLSYKGLILYKVFPLYKGKVLYTSKEAIMADILDIRQYKNLLFDFYGTMLTDKQKQAFTLHTAEDCSMAEIAEEMGTTPQAVVDIIRRATAQLENYENGLKLVSKHLFRQTIEENIEQELETLESLGNNQATEIAQNIKRLMGSIYGI